MLLATFIKNASRLKGGKMHIIELVFLAFAYTFVGLTVICLIVYWVFGLISYINIYIAFDNSPRLKDVNWMYNFFDAIMQQKDIKPCIYICSLLAIIMYIISLIFRSLAH